MWWSCGRSSSGCVSCVAGVTAAARGGGPRLSSSWSRFFTGNQPAPVATKPKKTVSRTLTERLVELRLQPEWRKLMTVHESASTPESYTPLSHTFPFDEENWGHVQLSPQQQEGLSQDCVSHQKEFIEVGRGSKLWRRDGTWASSVVHIATQPKRTEDAASPSTSAPPKDTYWPLLWQAIPEMPPALWVPFLSVRDASNLINYYGELSRNGERLESITGHEESFVNASPATMYNMFSKADPLEVMGDMLYETETPYSQKLVQLRSTKTKGKHFSSAHLFMGMIGDFRLVETAFMLNPFTRIRPIILGSLNETLRDSPIILSCFHSVLSRSVLVLECHKELMLDGPDHPPVFPLYARIFYLPCSSEGSKMTVQNFNATFGTGYPLNMPVDVLAAFSSYYMCDSSLFRSEVEHCLSCDGQGQQPNPMSLVHTGLLRDPTFPELFNHYYQSDDQDLRAACALGAVQFQQTDLLDRLLDSPQDPHILELIETAKRTSALMSLT